MSRSRLIPARPPPRRNGFHSDMRNRRKKMKWMPAGERRTGQTRKVCWNEEVKLREDEERGMRSLLAKEVS